MMNLNESANRLHFFDDVTRIIEKFKVKMKAIGNAEKAAVEIAFAYLIQFVLYKVLVDNGCSPFKKQYDILHYDIKLATQNKDFYRLITNDIRNVSEYVAKHIYKPFAEELETINNKLMNKLVANPTIDDVAPWFEIIMFIDKYDFSNIKNEIFGFVYENYLKGLYKSENKGQYFTDPAVVNFMLDQLGYSEKNLAKNENRLSLIDPACGAGTFLYSAVDRIVHAYTKTDNEKQFDNIQELVDENIFGLDVEPFPLFLGEMSILMRLLPLIVNDNDEIPIDHKLKIFKTKDSISEFLKPHRQFDYVIGNPPYLGYNECCKQDMPFIKKLQDKNDPSITMGNVYGVNLHSVPGAPKTYAPKPNLYALFIALGLALLQDEGKLCYIIPQTLLTAGDLDVLRYHLATHTTIEKIITFGGNLFMGRGFTKKNSICTSSLILIVKKTVPRKGHVVKITNFKPYAEIQEQNLAPYFRCKNKVSKVILQDALKLSTENWNFIKHDDEVQRFCRTYIAHTKSIEEYRRFDLNDYNEVQFDKGLVFDKKKINVGNADWSLIKKNKECYTIGFSGKFLDTKYIRFPQGTQGLSLFRNKYKIIWGYMNFDKFYFSDASIMINVNWVIISSNNKTEILFLLAILNSPISACLFDSYLRSEHEQALLLGIKSVKQYIRMPKMTSSNEVIKTEIIKQTKALLILEKNIRRDMVDMNKQMAIKTYIDDLVFALYFNVPVPKLGINSATALCKACEKNEFYRVVARNG